MRSILPHCVAFGVAFGAAFAFAFGLRERTTAAKHLHLHLE